MELKVTSIALRDIEAGAVIAAVFEDSGTADRQMATLDSALDNHLTRLIGSGEIKGKLNRITRIFTLGKLPFSSVFILGLGKRDELTADRIRGAYAEACRTIEQQDIPTAAALLFENSPVPDNEIVRSITEGALLGTYTFRHHVTKKAEHGELENLSIIAPDSADLSLLEEGRKTGEIIGKAVLQARDMVNSPANFMTPTIMAATAKNIAAKAGISLEVLEKEQMDELGMGGLLGVSAGTEQPPKFIVLSYNGTTSPDIDIALIGKAITFDSGGISIKPSSGMEEMKGDMSGGAAVIAAMGAIGKLKPSVNVLGIVPATENLPSGKALKPGDVISAMGGTTIEIISTDAEGRLILADAIGYARRRGAKRIVDTATLTGAMAAAFGDVCFGAFSNNQELADSVITAGREVGERIWQMPMYDDYKELNKSDVADIKNTGGKYAGSITAAHFLGEFVGDVPWVHLDIAGMFLSDKTRNYTVKGATGVPVRTLVNLVMKLGKS